MAILQKFPPKILYQAPLLMNSISSHSTLKSLLFSPNFRLFTPSFLDFTNTHLPFQDRSCKKRPQVSVRVSDLQLKENWLDSLSSPFGERVGQIGINSEAALRVGAGPEWVIGIDPDISGAVAVLKDDCSLLSAQVFDTPHLQVLVGKRVRKRLDARSIVQLLHSFGLPHGMRWILRQIVNQNRLQFSHILRSDNDEADILAREGGWWCGGFGYGLWTGILVASGFSVVPVPSLLWKNQFELRGTSSTKDESRNVASKLFPSLSSLLKRKKDHGRAEAFLIAAYGKGLKKPS